MQSTFQLILSGCTGVILGLASRALLAPRVAVLTAMAGGGSAWALLKLECRLVRFRRADDDELQHDGALAGEGMGSCT